MQDGPEHRSWHSPTQVSNTTGFEEGQVWMQAAREPPGQPVCGLGPGLGRGPGLGVGAGAEYVPLVTQPPHASSLGAPTALFNQH